MKTTSWDKNMPEINTKGISSVSRKYLKEIGESSIKDISLSKGSQLFLLVIEDFRKGILSSDDLSDFGFKIFHGIAKNYPESDLFQASLSASELSFYLRAKGSYKDIPQYLEDVDKFYEKNKTSKK